MNSSCSPSRVRFDFDSSPYPRPNGAAAADVDDDAEGSPLPNTSPQQRKQQHNQCFEASPSPVAAVPQIHLSQQHQQQLFMFEQHQQQEHELQQQQQTSLDQSWGCLFRALADEHGVVTEGSVHARLSMLLPALDWALPLYDSGVLNPPKAAPVKKQQQSRHDSRHHRHDDAAAAAAAAAEEQREEEEKEHNNNNNNNNNNTVRRRRGASTTAISIPSSVSPARNNNNSNQQKQQKRTGSSKSHHHGKQKDKHNTNVSQHQHQQHQHASATTMTRGTSMMRLIDGSTVQHMLFRRVLRHYLPVLGYNTLLPIGVVEQGGFTDPAQHLDVFSGFVASSLVSRLRAVAAASAATEIMVQQGQEEQQVDEEDVVDPEALYSALLAMPLAVNSVQQWSSLRDSLLQSCGEAAPPATEYNNNNKHQNSTAPATATGGEKKPMQHHFNSKTNNNGYNFRPYCMPILTAFGEPSDEDETVRILLLVLLRNVKLLRGILQRYEAPPRQLARVLVAKRISFAVSSSSADGGGVAARDTMVVGNMTTNNTARRGRSVSVVAAGAAAASPSVGGRSFSRARNRSEAYHADDDDETKTQQQQQQQQHQQSSAAAHDFAQSLCRWTLHLWTGARGVLDTPIMQRIGEKYMLQKAKQFQLLAKRFRRFFVELEDQDDCDVLRAGRANSPGELRLADGGASCCSITPAIQCLVPQPSMAGGGRSVSMMMMMMPPAATPAAAAAAAASAAAGAACVQPSCARSVSPAVAAASAAGASAASPFSAHSNNNNNNNSLFLMSQSTLHSNNMNQQHRQQQQEALEAQQQRQKLTQEQQALDQLAQHPAVWLKQVENSMEPPPLSLLHHMLPEDREELVAARKWAAVRAFVVGFIAALLIAGSDVMASMALFGPDASMSTKLGVGADFGLGGGDGGKSGGVGSIVQFLGPAVAAADPHPSTTTTTPATPPTNFSHHNGSFFNFSGISGTANASSAALNATDAQQLLGTKEAIAYWIVVLSATAVVSALEILYLYIDALNTCYDCAVVVGIVLRHRTEDGQRESWRDVIRQQLSSINPAATGASSTSGSSDGDEEDDEEPEGDEEDDDDDNNDGKLKSSSSNNHKRRKKKNRLHMTTAEEEDAQFTEELIDIFVPDTASPIGSPSRLRRRQDNGGGGGGGGGGIPDLLAFSAGSVSPGRTARVARGKLRGAVSASLRAAAKVREVISRKRCKFVDGAISRCALSLGHGSISLFGINLNRRKDGWARAIKSLFQLLRTPLSVAIVQLLLGRLVWKVFIPFVSAPICAMWNAVIIWGAISEMHSTVVAAVGAERLVLEVAQKCKDLHLGGSVMMTAGFAAAGDEQEQQNVQEHNNPMLLASMSATNINNTLLGSATNNNGNNGTFTVTALGAALPDTVDPDYAMPHHVLQLWARCAFSIGAVEAVSSPSFHIVVAGLLQRLGSIVPMRAQTSNENSSSSSHNSNGSGANQSGGAPPRPPLDKEVDLFMSSLSNEQEIARLDLTNARLFFVALAGALVKSSKNSGCKNDQARQYTRGVATSVLSMQLALLIVLGKLDSVCSDGGKSKYRKMLAATIACFAAPKIAFAAAGAAAQVAGTGTSTAIATASSSAVGGGGGGDSAAMSDGGFDATAAASMGGIGGGDDRQRSISRMLHLDRELEKRTENQIRRQYMLANRMPSQQLLQEHSDNNNKKQQQNSSACCWCCWCVDTSCCNEIGEFTNADIRAAFMYKINDRAKAVTAHLSAFLFGSSKEKSILWSELTEDKSTVASQFVVGEAEQEDEKQKSKSNKSASRSRSKKHRQSSPFSASAAASAAAAAAPAAVVVPTAIEIEAPTITEEGLQQRRNEPISASPSPLKQQQPQRAASSSPLVVGRIVRDTSPGSMSQNRPPLSSSLRPSAAPFGGNNNNNTPSPLLLSNQLVPRRRSLASSASPSRRAASASPLSLSASLNNLNASASRWREALPQKEKSSSKSRQSSPKQQHLQLRRSQSRRAEEDSDDEEAMIMLDQFFGMAEQERNVPLVAKSRSSSADAATSSAASVGRSSAASSSQSSSSALPPQPPPPGLLSQQTMPMFSNNSRGISSSSSSSSSNISATERDHQQEDLDAVRLLMFEAGAAAKSRSQSQQQQKAMNESGSSLSRVQSTTRRNSAASAATAAGFNAASGNTDNKNSKNTSSASSAPSSRLSGNSSGTIGGDSATAAATVDLKKQLMGLNQRLLTMQRKFNEGAPMPGSQIVDVAAAIVDLVSMWEYRDS